MLVRSTAGKTDQWMDLDGRERQVKVVRLVTFQLQSIMSLVMCRSSSNISRKCTTTSRVSTTTQSRVDKARSTLLFNEHCCTISPARPSNKIVAVAVAVADAAEEAAFLVVLPFCFLHPSSSFVVVPACPQVLLLVLVYSGWLQL